MPLAHLRCARRTEPVGRLESFVSLSLFIPPSIRDGGVAFSKRWICPFFFSFYSLLLGEGGCWFYSTSAQEPLGGSFEMFRDVARATHCAATTCRIHIPQLNETRPWSSYHIRDVSFDPSIRTSRFSYILGGENLFRTLSRRSSKGSDFLPQQSHHTIFSSDICAVQCHFSHNQKNLGFNCCF